jgi:hypothetical protein
VSPELPLDDGEGVLGGRGAAAALPGAGWNREGRRDVPAAAGGGGAGVGGGATARGCFLSGREEELLLSLPLPLPLRDLFPPAIAKPPSLVSVSATPRGMSKGARLVAVALARDGPAPGKRQTANGRLGVCLRNICSYCHCLLPHALISRLLISLDSPNKFWITISSISAVAVITGTA